jgi:lipoprotein-anchoring transpeptidase ErfK/SrfK
MVALAVMVLLSSCGRDDDSPTASPTVSTTMPSAASPSASPTISPHIRPLPVSAAQIARLPAITTYATLRRAPEDPDPFHVTDGFLIHPTVKRVVYSRPGGPPLGVLPTTQLQDPTWVPVVQRLPGWDRILLPSRPNRSTGWIYTDDGGLRGVYSTYQVRVELAARRLTVFDAGRRLGSWPVAVGAPGTPTPRGRTFLLASVTPGHQTYTPLFLALGAHSGTLDTFAGGPATIALHGWPDRSAFGREVSYGCVRVPSAALDLLSRLPLGSPIMITD